MKKSLYGYKDYFNVILFFTRKITFGNFKYTVIYIIEDVNVTLS